MDNDGTPSANELLPEFQKIEVAVCDLNYNNAPSVLYCIYVIF